MKTLAAILALSAGLAAFPTLADSMSTDDNPVVLTGGRLCVGPACIGRDRDRDRDSEYRPRHGYGWDREGGCRDITIRRDDGSVKHIRRCD